MLKYITPPDPEHPAGAGDGPGVQPQPGRAEPGRQAASGPAEGASGGALLPAGGGPRRLPPALRPAR